MSAYLGSKSGHGVWQRIAAEIPPHDLLIVPFAGQCALTRNLQPTSKRLLFENDRKVCDYWSDLYASDLSGEVDIGVRQRCGIAYLESIATACDAERELPIPMWAQPVFKNHSDQLEWFDQRVVIYCDPPYVTSTRTSAESRYRYDLHDDDHERLLSVIRRLPCRVLISGYDSELYRQRLADWRVVTFNATTRGKRKVRTEYLWINREPIEVTYMPLMVGTSRRQREIIKRRLARIATKAERIPETDVDHWLQCLSHRRKSPAVSPNVSTVPSEEPLPNREQAGLGMAACGRALCSPTSHHPLCGWSDKFGVAPGYAGSIDRSSPRVSSLPSAHLEASSPKLAAAGAAVISDTRAAVVSTPAESRIDELREFSISVTREFEADERGRARIAGAGGVLSLFSGLDLLGEAFREQGFTVDSAGDIQWAKPIQSYRGRLHSHEGIIAGVPCQRWSQADPCRVPKSRVDFSATTTHEGVLTIREFLRVVDEVQPLWWLAECVPGVPDLIAGGYHVQRLNLTDVECGGTQRRLRSIQFGSREFSSATDAGGVTRDLAAACDLVAVHTLHRDHTMPTIIRPKRLTGRVATEPAVLASKCREDDSAFERRCRTMGLTVIPDLSAFTKAARFRLVGNAVPLTMGRVLARAVIERGPITEADCICGCGQVRQINSQYSAASNASCRKRFNSRKRTRFVVDRPSPNLATVPSAPLYSIGTWNPDREAFTPHGLSVNAFNITRAELVLAIRELRRQGYSCHRVRRDGQYDDNDPSVLIERTDGQNWKIIRRRWNR